MNGKQAQQQARTLLSAFDQRMLPHGKEVAELLNANVPAHTIESLYPFEIGDYAPYIVATLQVPHYLEAIAHIIGGSTLTHALRALPSEAYGRADRIVWFDGFFDGDEALAGLHIETPNEPEINGNAVFLMKQWGYLLLFLHECAFCPSLPEHQCVEVCFSQKAARHAIEQEESEFFAHWFEVMGKHAVELLDLLYSATTP